MFTKPTSTDSVTNSVFLLDKNTDTSIGFEFFNKNLEPNNFNYCNKVFVASCITMPELIALEVDKVEFQATDDPCECSFNIDINSDDDLEIEKQLDSDNKLIGIIVKFSKDASYPLLMSYKLRGYLTDSQIVLSQGLIMFK